MHRESILHQLTSQQFDVLIIGGGITGTGAARDAVYRGMKVALIDMNDLAYGTSSRSSKLVHGGLRYLENLEFSLVFEAVSERQTLLHIAPHLVHPLGFLFPVYEGSRRSAFTINLGMWLYDGLSLFRSPKIHQNLSKKQVQKIEPALGSATLKRAPLYYDCSTDDARLTLENALDAVHDGAVVATYVKAKQYRYNDQGRIVGILATDVLTNTDIEIACKTCINCTGPWSDKTRQLNADGVQYLRPTKGVHIVVDHQKLPINNAVVCFHPKDGRVLFAIPWSDRTYIGTTDTDFIEDLEDIAATAEDVRYLLDASNAYFPDYVLAETDVISTWAGVRPLIADDASTESSVSREHSVRIEANGLITIAGGKLTTYRKMAMEVVDRSVDMLRLMGVQVQHGTKNTATEPLPGAKGWSDKFSNLPELLTALENKASSLIQSNTISLASVHHIATIYGMVAFDIVDIVEKQPQYGATLVANRPEILAQVVYAAEKELASTLCDIFVRRTQLFFRDLNQGLDCVDVVADIMAKLLQWSPDRTQQEKDLYREEVQRSRRWQNH